MNERAIIEERIRKKVAEVQQLEDKLRNARIYVQALSDVMRALSADTQSETEPKPGSMIAQTKDAILAAGRPVHVNDLLVAIGRSEDSKNSLTGSLAAYVRRGEIFTRPAPNTYGLVELGHTTVEADADSGPPAGFGGAAKKPLLNTSDYADDLDDDVPF